MSDFLALTAMMAVCFISGFFAGADSESRKTVGIRTQCEAELPRDKYCVMVAVPEEAE